MAKFELQIKPHNVQPHIDIEKDLQERRNGLFTFTLRTKGSQIVDYNVTEYVDVGNKYFSFKPVVIEEHSITYVNRAGSSGDPLRDDNL